MKRYSFNFKEELSKPDCNLIELYEHCAKYFYAHVFINYLVDNNNVGSIKEILSSQSFSVSVHIEMFCNILINSAVNRGRIDLLAEVIHYIDINTVMDCYKKALIREIRVDVKRKGFVPYLRKLFVMCPIFQKEIMSNEI